jgi:hypothetical protein
MSTSMPTSRTIDHRTLRNLVEAGAQVGAEVIGQAGAWGVVVHYGRARQTLAAARGEPRMFRNFSTLAGYLKGLGVTECRVNLAGYEPAAKDTTSRRSVTAAERMRAAHAAAEYDKWFRAQVQASLDDPRPSVPDGQAREAFAARREALRKRAARRAKGAR